MPSIILYPVIKYQQLFFMIIANTLGIVKRFKIQLFEVNKIMRAELYYIGKSYGKA